MKDTIIALATPSGRGGVAIIRLSGINIKNIAEKILHKIPNPRYAMFTPFYDENDRVMDEGLALYFPAPHSFTGEDILELHCHGGPALVDLIIKTILRYGGIRLARPGEFSERAFLNDKIDLTQAEAIADLINASSEQAVRASVRSLQGEFSKQINSLLEALIYLRTYIEASIDFVEEEIDFLNNEVLFKKFKNILQHLQTIEDSATQGCLLREGITAVITGEPNVGKSSLLNKLSGKDTAIVTDVPGTTRDVLREYILLDGMPIHIIDTAGLRESDDIVEQEGIRRAKEEINRADLLLMVTDINNDSKWFDIHSNISANKILIRNKIDLSKESPTITQENGVTVISLSAKTGTGIDLLKEHIKSLAGYQPAAEGCFSARRRHLDALNRAKDHIQHGYDQLREKNGGELIAEELRLAQNALSEIMGEFTSDDLLGRIFSSFCIGK